MCSGFIQVILLLVYFTKALLTSYSSYSYMRRYPKVNESRSFWNPSLPALRVLEDNELVANGACNTGVLLFDSMSLGRFMEGLSAALSDNVVDQFYENDRFLDSLYFVYVVNSMGIEVTLWPYFMNYMAFFEVEILEDLQEEKIVFAHFLTDTEFFCEFREACRCVYYNKFIPEGSLIVKNIQRLLPSEQCLSMSGIDPSTTRINETEDENFLQSVQRISTCQLKWPPLHESTVLYRANRDFIPLNIEIVCTICLDDSFVAGDIELSVTANFSFYQRVLDSSNVREKRSVRNTVQTEAIFKVGLAGDNSTDEYHKRRVDSQVHIMVNLSHTINLKLPTLHSLIQGPIILDSHIIVQSIEPIESTLKRCTIDCVAPRSTETDSTLSVFDRSSIVLIESLLPNSETAYAKNLLLGLKSVSLESQLFLADYLNERMIVGSVGVAMCCDTFMGVRVVERLIGLWSGDALFIWVKQVPNDGTFHLLGQLMDHFRAICDSKDRLCVLFSHQSASERSIAASLSVGSLSFVYVDVFNEYDEFLQNLISWFRHLRKGGLLVGSRLTSLRSQQNYIEGVGNSEYGGGDGPMCVEEAVSRQYFNRSAVIMQGNFKSATPKDDVSGIRRAVDSLSFLFSTVYLATYNEAMWNNRDWLPAWYFHKLMN